MADGSLELEALDRLMTALRPRLHRYCARMVGSAIDGEDVVQEALAKAAEAFPSAGPIARPESWLFRIAHNAALDALRHRKRQAAVRSDMDMTGLADPLAAADARVAATASLARLAAPAPRPALERGADGCAGPFPGRNGRDHRRQPAGGEGRPAPGPYAVAGARRHARQPLCRSWRRPSGTGCGPMRTASTPATSTRLRDLLAEDVRLDLPNRIRLAGRKEVSVYFTRYAAVSDCRLSPGLAEGRPALLVSDPADATGARQLCDAARLGRGTDRRDPRFPARALYHGMPGDLASLGDNRACS